MAEITKQVRINGQMQWITIQTEVKPATKSEIKRVQAQVEAKAEAELLEKSEARKKAAKKK